MKKNRTPIRHRLPLWEPFAVLGALSILVGALFLNNNQNKSIKNRKNYCSKCGNKLKTNDKFCSTCGDKV